MKKIQEIAHEYLSLGWCIVPLEAQSKRCVLQGWEQLKIKKRDILKYFPLESDRNIGVRFEGPLVDIDLDTRESQAIWPHFLPQTASFGRGDSKVTHLLYHCKGLKKTRRITGPPDHKVYLEIRGSAESYTMFPGSVHPSEGLVIWHHEPDKLTTISKDKLEQLCFEAAAASILVAHWPRNNRHDMILAWSAVLLNNGWKEDRIERFCWAIAKEGARLGANKPGPRQSEITNCITHTAEKINNREPVIEWEYLKDAVRSEVLKKVKALLKLSEGWESLLSHTTGGGLKGNEKNLLLILKNDPEYAGRFTFNKRFGYVELDRKPVEDELTVDIVLDVGRRYGVDFTTKMVQEDLYLISQGTQVDELEEWLKKLKWDGRSRIDTWLTRYLGAVDSKYTRAVGLCWLVSAVARALEPGCQADHVLVLEGREGTKKTTCLKILAGKSTYYASIVLEKSMDKKGLCEDIRGPWLVELEEIDQIRVSQTSWAKRFLSVTADKFRAPFQRLSVEYPRRCVFCGTTNEVTYMRGDNRQNRRFWPVGIQCLNENMLKRDRAQLWAEAVVCFRKGIPWHLSEEVEALAREEQSKRAPEDSASLYVAESIKTLHSGKDRISLLDALKMVQEVPDIGKGARYRVRPIMESLGWHKRQVKIDGSPRWFWVNWRIPPNKSKK